MKYHGLKRMKYHGSYEVDPAFIVDGKIRWECAGCKEYLVATKDGKKYAIERSMCLRYPTKGMSKPIYDAAKAAADKLQKDRERLRELMQGLDWASDHIVVEEESFWDSDNMFATVTAYVPNALPVMYDYTSLPLKVFLQLATQTAEAVDKLHACKVIHGDIKNRSITVTYEDGAYTPYVGGVDSSYPTDAIPDWENIGGTEGYQSPEVIIYGLEDEDIPKDKSTITPATDIFSLGVVFHKWWTGKFPDVDLERCLVGAAVYLGKDVAIDKKFDVRIGDNYGATLSSLIGWMIAKNPADRPTARQVADVLADKSEVPDSHCRKQG